MKLNKAAYTDEEFSSLCSSSCMFSDVRGIVNRKLRNDGGVIVLRRLRNMKIEGMLRL